MVLTTPRHRAVSLLAAALLLAGCSGMRPRQGPSGNLETVPAASKCGFGKSGFSSAPFPWTGDRAPLSRRGVAGYPRSRLVLDAKDRGGGTTEFIVDTGTSCVLLAHTAPAARGASLGAERLELLANGGATSFVGRDAVIPSIDLGGLAGRDVPVFLLERSHDLRSPANVLGMVLLTGLALVHAGPESWSLVRATALPAPVPGTRTVRQQAPGLPVVTLRGPDGETVYALVDTGTPTSLFAPGRKPGTYRLEDGTGSTVLEVRALQQAPWRNLEAGGRMISVWIGLDALDAMPFTMDFSTAAWTFPPRAGTRAP